MWPHKAVEAGNLEAFHVPSLLRRSHIGGPQRDVGEEVSVLDTVSILAAIKSVIDLLMALKEVVEVLSQDSKLLLEGIVLLENGVDCLGV